MARHLRKVDMSATLSHFYRTSLVYVAHIFFLHVCTFFARIDKIRHWRKLWVKAQNPNWDLKQPKLIINVDKFNNVAGHVKKAVKSFSIVVEGRGFLKLPSGLIGTPPCLSHWFTTNHERHHNCGGMWIFRRNLSHVRGLFRNPIKILQIPFELRMSELPSRTATM